MGLIIPNCKKNMKESNIKPFTKRNKIIEVFLEIRRKVSFILIEIGVEIKLSYELY